MTNISSDTKHFVGYSAIKILDEAANITFNVLVQYPTAKPSQEVAFGTYIMDVSTNAEMLTGQFPLILISHGNGGSHLVYRSISLYLAQRGYIVALIEHYGNNRLNNELEKSIINLQYRPLHSSLTIDYLLNNEFFASHINSKQIGFIGHSFGGYTGLALAGGKPCTKEGLDIEVKSDNRIKLLVLMAPAAAFFMKPMALLNVKIPILLLIAEKDSFTPKAITEDLILKGVSNPVNVKTLTINNAGHFSFITPFPVAMASPNFLPSTDPDGFDRQKFHEELPGTIHDYLVQQFQIIEKNHSNND